MTFSQSYRKIKEATPHRSLSPLATLALLNSRKRKEAPMDLNDSLKNKTGPDNIEKEKTKESDTTDGVVVPLVWLP